MTLDDSVTELKGIGEAVATKFAVLGIRTIGHLIDYYPRRYEDYSEIASIAQLAPGPVSIEAVIKQVVGRYVRRGMHITEAVASDKTGSVRIVWFNQPYRAAAIKNGQSYYISGQFELSHQKFTIMNPSMELASDFPLNTARIIPVYKETKGLTSRQIRAAIKQAVPLIKALPDPLPPEIITDQKLLSYSQALVQMHFPDTSQTLAAARKRLGFEEVFRLTLASLLNKQAEKMEQGVVIAFDEAQAKAFVKHLPFKLTDSQRKTIWQILLDMQRPRPMNRLVEGDVGSGKTVVATMAALMVLQQKMQVAMMAPTELLARQHADTIHRLLEPLGLSQAVGLLVGSMSQSQKTAARSAVADGRIRFVVGTQALIQDMVDMHSLALVVIDEQHRFGVDQRKALQIKAGHMPHVLSLTATPIPRSLALTLYGELDVSVMTDKPPGRLPIITQLVSPNSQAALYASVDEQLRSGRQLFVVCPLISESDVAVGKSAEQVYEQLRRHELKDWRVGLLHGKLKPAEKVEVMRQFVEHELDALVSTTVIEVGVDVPNATIMVVESAERFGLAQIHQLRGRVGRGQHQGCCYLMLSDSKPPSRRLRALESSSDGFRLAELDLELRGPGAIYGNMQHGALDLRVAKLSDTKLIAAARTEAQRLLDSGQDLVQYKELMAHVAKLRAVTNLN